MSRSGYFFMRQFYCPNISTNLQLPDDEAKHVIKVLRMNRGDEFMAIDGLGGLYHCKISSISGKQCAFEIIDKEESAPLQPHTHIAIAPTKNNDRLEWFLEKACEIGISRITPILCEQSERKVIKRDRFDRILISAMKQSKQLFLPQLDDLIKFPDFLNQFEGGFIAHCEEGEKSQLQKIYKKGQNALILIGPEGDFSSNEIELATKSGFKSVSLGNSRLRTETAGIVACHTIRLLNDA